MTKEESATSQPRQLRSHQRERFFSFSPISSKQKKAKKTHLGLGRGGHGGPTSELANKHQIEGLLFLCVGMG